MTIALVATDGSEHAISAAKAGLSLLPPDAQLVVTTVVEAPDPTLAFGVSGMAGAEMTGAEWEEMRDALHHGGEDAVASTIAALGRQAEGRVAEGSAGPTLCDVAGELAADVIVIGSSGRSGLGRAMLGSVSDYVLRNAPCPVLVARHDTAQTDGPIVVGTDGSDAALHAATAGLQLLTRGPVVLVTVAEAFRHPLPYDGSLAEHVIATDAELAAIDAAREAETTKALDDTAAAIGRDDVERRVGQGRPADVVCAVASEVRARVVVIGSRGRGVVARAFLGSVSDHVVRHAPCPVFVDRVPD